LLTNWSCHAVILIHSSQIFLPLSPALAPDVNLDISLIFWSNTLGHPPRSPPRSSTSVIHHPQKSALHFFKPTRHHPKPGTTLPYRTTLTLSVPYPTHTSPQPLPCPTHTLFHPTLTYSNLPIPYIILAHLPYPTTAISQLTLPYHPYSIPAYDLLE